MFQWNGRGNETRNGYKPIQSLLSNRFNYKKIVLIILLLSLNRKTLEAKQLKFILVCIVNLFPHFLI